jgi:hypothetical protein
LALIVNRAKSVFIGNSQREVFSFEFRVEEQQLGIWQLAFGAEQVAQTVRPRDAS